MSAPTDEALRRAAAALGLALCEAGLTLTLAESCTGGWAAKVVTDVPGASDWFDAGFVTYSNAAKNALLGVDRELIDEHGAVSEPVVNAMASGARRRSGAGAAVAISGVAGPGGGTPDKPVGLVWFGFSLRDRDWAHALNFDGDRETVRRRSVAHAFERLQAAIIHRGAI